MGFVSSPSWPPVVVGEVRGVQMACQGISLVSQGWCSEVLNGCASEGPRWVLDVTAPACWGWGCAGGGPTCWGSAMHPMGLGIGLQWQPDMSSPARENTEGCEMLCPSGFSLCAQDLGGALKHVGMPSCVPDIHDSC